MQAAAAQPSLNELYSFISKVGTYPISAGQLLKLALEAEAPAEITNFYKNFAPDRVFENKDDLAGSSEQVELMHVEKSQMPKEEEVAPEEY